MVLQGGLRLRLIARNYIELSERRQAFGVPLGHADRCRIARESRKPLLPSIFSFLVFCQGVQLVGREAEKSIGREPQLDQPYPCGSLPESFLKVSIFFWSSASSSRATSSLASAFSLLILAVSSSLAIFSCQTTTIEGSFTTR